MPHIVIEEAPDLRAVCEVLKPSVIRDGSEILKVVDVYLNQAGRTALVDCVTVEDGRSQTFFVQLSQKDRQITVRLHQPIDENARKTEWASSGSDSLRSLLCEALRRVSDPGLVRQEHGSAAPLSG